MSTQNAPERSRDYRGERDAYPSARIAGAYAATRDVDAVMDIPALIGIFRRRILLFLGVTTVVLGASIGSALMLTPKYQATAVVRIDPQRSPLNLGQQPRGPLDQALVETEVQSIRSRQVAEAVVNRLNLIRDPLYNPDADKTVARGRPAGAEERRITVDNLLGSLTVEREGTTYLINISATSESAQRSAQVANAVAREYITSSSQTQVDTASEQSQILNDRLAALGAQIQGRRAQIASIRAASGIVEGGALGTVTDQQVGPIAGQLAAAEARAAEARSREAAAQAQIRAGGLDSVSNVLSSPVVTELRRQRAEVARRQAEITTRYGPRHPDVEQVNQQLAGLDAQIREEAQRQVRGLASEAEAASAQAASLRANLNRLRSEQAGNTRAAVAAEGLQRQVDADQQVYDQLASSAQQTTQQSNIHAPTAAIQSLAVTPESPAFPNVMLFAALGLVLGGVLAAASVLLRESLDRGVRTVNDVERALGVPYLASVPLLEKKQLRVKGRTLSPGDFVLEKPMSAYSEALRSVRSSLLLGDGDRQPRVIAVTSALPGEGKTSISISLARIMGMSGERVLLVDADLRRNASSTLTVGASNKGLVELLTGEATIDEVVVTDQPGGVDILPVPKAAFTPADVFSGGKLSEALEQLLKRYDRIILDTPPILAVADSRTVCAASDITLLIVKWRATHREAVRAALARLASDGTNLAGAVLSQADMRSRSSLSAGDPSRYYSVYGEYYQD